MSSREETRELIGDALGRRKSLLDCEHFSLPTLEGYSEPRGYEVHIRYGVRGVNNDCSEYRAIVKARLEEDVGAHLVRNWRSTPEFWHALTLLDKADIWDEEPMLVCYIGFVQKGEGHIFGPPGLVWLQRLKDCRCLRPHELFNLCLLEPFGPDADGETREPVFGGVPLGCLSRTSAQKK